MCKYVEDNLFFAGTGPPRNPYSLPADIKLCSKSVGAFHFIGNLSRVVFQRAGDDDIAGTNFSEALSVLVRLGKNQADFAEDISCERLYSLIPGVTFVADSTVDHNNGNS